MTSNGPPSGPSDEPSTGKPGKAKRGRKPQREPHMKGRQLRDITPRSALGPSPMSLASANQGHSEVHSQPAMYYPVPPQGQAQQSTQGRQPDMYSPMQPPQPAAPQMGYGVRPFGPSPVPPSQQASLYANGYGTPYAGQDVAHSMPLLTYHGLDPLYMGHAQARANLHARWQQDYAECTARQQQSHTVDGPRSSRDRHEVPASVATQLAAPQPRYPATASFIRPLVIAPSYGPASGYSGNPGYPGYYANQPSVPTVPVPVSAQATHQNSSNGSTPWPSQSFSDTLPSLKRTHNSEQGLSSSGFKTQESAKRRRDGYAELAGAQAECGAAQAVSVQSVVAGALDEEQEAGEEEESDSEEDAPGSLDEEARADSFRSQRDGKDEEDPSHGQGGGQDHGNGYCDGEYDGADNPRTDDQEPSGQNNQQSPGDNEVLQHDPSTQSPPSPPKPSSTPSPSTSNPSRSPSPPAQLSAFRPILPTPPCILPTPEPASSTAIIPFEPLVRNPFRPVDPRSLYPRRDITHAIKSGRRKIAEMEWQRGKARFVSNIEGHMERKRFVRSL